MTALDFTGPRLTAALQEQPNLTLEFYSYGVLLRKRDGDAVVEYPVDPQQTAGWRQTAGGGVSPPAEDRHLP